MDSVLKNALQKRIDDFLSLYRHDLVQLSQALKLAGISHYSSGCGTKQVTFDLFPAHGYVDEMLRMISLTREYKDKLLGGFKDSTAKNDYNPAHDFMLYLRRWQFFAEQAMYNEGASARGMSAAHAKLLSESLYARLSERKSGQALKTTAFCLLMKSIGDCLYEKERVDKAMRIASHKQALHHNFAQALQVLESKRETEAIAG